MAIKYDKKLNQEINKTIKNFNQKIARLEKDERGLLLPSKITKKKLKENVYTRSELRRKLKELQRFSKRGGENIIETAGGVRLTKYGLSNIRYDKKLNQEINKTIKNFNQKIARLEKDERDLLLPSKITKKELKENVFTRSELRRKLKELQRFSKHGAENIIETTSGVRLTQYELTNIKKENARVKANITRELKRLTVEKPKIFGKEQASTFSEMGDTDYLNLVARRKALEKDINKLSSEEFERFTKLVEKTGRSQQYMKYIFKENYFEMLTYLAYYFDYDNKKLSTLKEKLMSLNPNDFLKLFKDDKAIRAILDYYPIVIDPFGAIKPKNIKTDVINLYDNLIDNIDEIIQDYA